VIIRHYGWLVGLVDWPDRELKRGDRIVLRIIESANPTEPIAEHREGREGFEAEVMT
jgi:hypothetical protein